LESLKTVTIDSAAAEDRGALADALTVNPVTQIGPA
jgi:hypothetical protein